jgi:hypothetical protein
MEPNKINTGLDIDKQEIEQQLPEKRLMGVGSFWPVILKNKGDYVKIWNELAPETQFGRLVETMGCTGYGFNNIVEMLWLYQYGIKMNISDRAMNKMSGTTQQGNTVDAPPDTFRKKGFLLEEEWPWDREKFTWAEYYKTIPSDLLAKALKRTEEWGLEHEYVPNNPDAMINALNTGPLGGTVYAWSKGSDGIYRDYGNRANHFTVVILDYEYGKYWICGDSYPDDFQYNDNPQQPEFIKKLAWNYNFGCIKRYRLIDKRSDKTTNLTLLAKLKNMFKNLQAYMDSHGLHIWYVEETRGKQEIFLETIAEKALFMSYVKEGIIRTTSFSKLNIYPNFKFF